MIIRRPYKDRMDSGDPSSLLAGNGDDSEWPQKSRVKGQDDFLPCAIEDLVPPSPSVVPSPPPSSSSSSSSDSSTAVTPSPPPVTPSFPPTTPSFPPTVSSSFPPTASSSSPPVVTGPAPSPPFTGVDPTSPSSSVPFETIGLSSSSTSPSSLWSEPPPGLIISLPTFTTQSYLLVTSPNPTPTAESPVFPPTMTPTNTELWQATDGFGSEPEPSMTTNTNEIAPGASLDLVSHGGTVSRNRMIGAIAGSVLVAGLVLFGVIFYLRRRMSRRSLGWAVDTTHAMSNVSPRPGQSRVTEQRESGTIMQDQNPFLDPGNAAMRNPTPTVTAGQKQRSHLDRYSQVSTTSSGSRSIRFMVPGSYHSPTNSRSSRITISVTPTDVARTVTADPPTPPHSPVSVKTPVDHSAPWRGTNLSNIINAARGVKT